MSRKMIEVSVQPEVLRWARESSGSSIEEAAGRIGTSPALFARLERETPKLRLSQLRILADYYKRPLAAFLLSEPPDEPRPPEDFRMLPGQHRVLERETRLAIRKASRLRSVASEIMKNLGRDSSPKIESARLSDDPGEIAARERQALGVPIATQFNWTDERQAYRTWRRAVEERNILVFQIHLPLEDARGFSLSEGEPFAIAVSSSDAVHARIFTLFHEFAHLLLRRPAVCLPGKESKSKTSEAAVERWCNRFAGELLVPDSELRAILGEYPAVLETNVSETLAATSRRFRVSEHVALWRMREIELIPKALFNREMSRLQRLNKIRRKGGGGQFSASGRVLGENGRLFTSLVLEARGRNVVSYAEVVDYLSLRLKYLPEIQSSLATVAA